MEDGLIDSHAHLDGFARKGVLGEVLDRAREAGLGGIVAVGTDPDDWGLVRGLAGESGGFLAYTVGLHPCHVEENWDRAVEALERYFQEATPPVALGETGLDRFHLPKDPEGAARIFQRQLGSFRAHLEIVRRLDRPLIVHSRGAFAECVEEIDASGVDWKKVVFHCFSGPAGEMRELKRRGGFGSFTGILTYRNATDVRAAALEQGLDRLMLETDAPYLAPVPMRGKPNEPAYLRHTAEAAAEVFGVDYEEIVRVTTGNTRRFFGF